MESASIPCVTHTQVFSSARVCQLLWCLNASGTQIKTSRFLSIVMHYPPTRTRPRKSGMTLWLQWWLTLGLSCALRSATSKMSKEAYVRSKWTSNYIGSMLLARA